MIKDCLCFVIRYAFPIMTSGTLVTGMVKYPPGQKPPSSFSWTPQTHHTRAPSYLPWLSQIVPQLRSFPVSQLISSHLAKLYKFAICVRRIFRLQGHIHVFSSTLFILRLSSPHRHNFFAQHQYCQSLLTRVNVMLMNHSNTMLPYCYKSPLQRSFSGPWVLEDL